MAASRSAKMVRAPVTSAKNLRNEPKASGRQAKLRNEPKAYGGHAKLRNEPKGSGGHVKLRNEPRGSGHDVKLRNEPKACATRNYYERVLTSGPFSCRR